MTPQAGIEPAGPEGRGYLPSPKRSQRVSQPKADKSARERQSSHKVGLYRPGEQHSQPVGRAQRPKPNSNPLQYHYATEAIEI